MSKQGSVISGLMDSFATSISMALQYGVPLQVLVNKFVHMRFEPSGFTSNPNIRMAKSIVDYIFRWMALKFLSSDQQKQVGINIIEQPAAVQEEIVLQASEDEKVEDEKKEQATIFNDSKIQSSEALTMTFDNLSDAPACDTCGSVMVRNGACYKCLNCGGTSGCS
jgi:ribonucleoside-diphosphate reductase alpha chain